MSVQFSPKTEPTPIIPLASVERPLPCGNNAGNGPVRWDAPARRSQCLGNGYHMPTVLRTGPYRFYFYSHELHEPPHIHVDRDDLSAKFWLQPVGLARNFGFSPKELRRIQKLVAEHEAAFLEAWHGHLGAGG